jgi:hypothetical protein
MKSNAAMTAAFAVATAVAVGGSVLMLKAMFTPKLKNFN